MRSFLFIPTVLALVILSGCQRTETVDASQFDEAKWEERIKSPSLTEAEFTSLYAQAVAAELKGAEVKITGKRELSIKLANGSHLKAFLDNAWADAKSDPANRPQIVRRYIKAFAGVSASSKASSAPLDTNSIVAVVRDDAFLQQAAKWGMKTTNRLVFEPLVADINVVYATDHPEGIAYLTKADYEKLNMDLPALRKLAMTNLKRLLPKVERHGTGPVFMLVADGNYESSLLLADKLWDNLSNVVSGEIVAAVPARDVLIFTGSKSPEGIRSLRETAAATHKEASHAISTTLLVRRSDRWEKFKD